MDEPTPNPAARRSTDGREIARRLLDVARSAAPTGTPASAVRPSDARLVVGLEVDVADREGGPWVQYVIVLFLHRRTSACARVVLHDERANELLRVFEQELTSSTVARVRGGFPLSGECELWCEAVLLDDGDARGAAFAWIGPGRARPRGETGPPEAPVTARNADHAGHGPGLRMEANMDRPGQTTGRSE